MILERIVENKKRRLEEEMRKISIEGWKERLKRPGLHRPVDFFTAIKRREDISIIAEVKKASPSKGIIREAFDPQEIAMEYSKADIQAISVLTEKDFFLGEEEYLVGIRQAVPLPILRKDFIIDLWQIYQSRCLGADAILLIAAILSESDLNRFQIVAGILGLQSIVEVHDRADLEKALNTGAKIIGINNRDLNTFEVNLKTTEPLINFIPNDRAVVSESGISNAEDIGYLRSLGVDAVLIGEAFMRSESIAQKASELRAR